MVSAIHDLRYGARPPRRAPLFTILAVTSLVIGLSRSVALFTVMNAAPFRSLPGVETGDVYKLYTSNSSGGSFGASSFADYQSMISRAPEVFAAPGVSTNAHANVAADGNVRSLPGALVNGGYFELLKLAPHRGRLPTARRRGEWRIAGGGDQLSNLADTAWRRSERCRTRGHYQRCVCGRRWRGPARIRGLSLDGGADFEPRRRWRARRCPPIP